MRRIIIILGVLALVACIVSDGVDGICEQYLPPSIDDVAISVQPQSAGYSVEHSWVQVNGSAYVLLINRSGKSYYQQAVEEVTPSSRLNYRLRLVSAGGIPL